MTTDGRSDLTPLSPAATVDIDVSTLFDRVAKLDRLRAYVAEAVRLAGEGRVIVLTGAAPVWLYLSIAHALHGKARRLIYRSPASGDVMIFDHDPF